jgi:hypothetical protein
MYQPIRDTFEELNRQLVDRKVFDARQKQAEVDQGLKNAMLEGQLAQRQFMRDKAQLEIDLQRDKMEMAGRLQSAQIKQIHKNVEVQNAELAKEAWKQKKVEFSVRDMLGNDGKLVENDAFMQERFLRLFGSPGVDVDYDPVKDRVVDKDGVPIRRTNEFIMNVAMPNAMAHRSAVQDDPERAREILKVVPDQITALKKERKTYDGTNRFVGRRSDIDRKIKAKEKQIRVAEEQLLPQSRYEFWRSKELDMREAARYAIRWPKLAKQYREDAEAARKHQKDAMADMAKTNKAAKSGTDATLKGYNKIRETITPKLGGPLGFATKNQLAAAGVAERLFNLKKAQTPEKFTETQSLNLAHDSIEMVRKAHNKYLQYWATLAKDLESGEIDQAQHDITKSDFEKEAEALLGYVPIMKWSDMLAQSAGN